MTTTAVATGKYLYCIIRCSDRRTFDGVDGIGIGGPVQTLAHNGLAAVVSDAHSQQYDCTRANMLAHQRVLERVMREFAPLPVRFGCVAAAGSASQDVWKLLERRAGEFGRLLDEMEGKAELGVKALWADDKPMVQEALAESEAIRNLWRSLEGKPLAATHYERVRLGEMVAAALSQKQRAEGAAILAQLRPLAHRVAENPLLTNRMVLNAAFLVSSERDREFDDAVSALAAKLGPRTAFRYVGPVPAYNFVNITVNWQEL